MRFQFRLVSILGLFICLFSISSTKAKELELCERVGILSAAYLDETPPRLVIYDAEFSLAQSAPIYKVRKKHKRRNYEQVGTEALNIGTTLSYRVDGVGGKQQSQIKEIWILPRGHCHASE